MSATDATDEHVIRRDTVQGGRTAVDASEAVSCPEVLSGALDVGVLDVGNTGAPLSSRMRRGVPS